MILNYLKTRLSLWKFLSLAILLSLLVFDKSANMLSWGLGITFLFGSFLVFRFIDDAGSVTYDRQNHPDRDYVNQENYPKFLVITGIIVAIYIVILALNIFSVWLVLSVFIGLSILLYFVFNGNNFILSIIPLLKYPVLLWAASQLDSSTIPYPILLSSFFIMASYDALETLKDKPSNLWICLTLILISGLLLFQPWENSFNLVFILIVLVAVLLTRQKSYVQFIPVLYFPITVFILSNI